jgi:hypothetical protein
MLTTLQSRRTAVILSALTLLLFMERIFLDFRYVALEMEAVDAVMPFTAPYMGVAFLVIGGWIWGLLAAQNGKRGALITLLLMNLLAVLFGVGTLVFLCPTPCATGAPIADVLDWTMTVVGIAAALSAGLAFRSQGEAA